MKHATVKFECPNCQGQINVVGAIVYPTFVNLAGKCEKCDTHAILPVADLLSKMFEVMEEQVPS